MHAAVSDLVGVLLFSAFPFVSVQALADSDFGKKLQVWSSKCDVPLSELQLTDLKGAGSFSLEVHVSSHGSTAPLQERLEDKKPEYRAQERRKAEEMARARQQRCKSCTLPAPSLCKCHRLSAICCNRGIITGLDHACSPNHIPESPKWLGTTTMHR